MALTEGQELGLVGGNLAIASGDSVYVRDSGNEFWRESGRNKQAFGTYGTAISSSGYRPTRITDSEGNIWHFSATNDVGSDLVIDRYPVARAVTSDGIELFETLAIEDVRIIGGKPVVIGGNIWFFYLTEGLFNSSAQEIHVAKFTAASPEGLPVISSFWVAGDPAYVAKGFDVRITEDTGQALVMWWGENLDGSDAAVAVAKLDTATGLPVSVVYSQISGLEAAGFGGCLFVNERSADGYLGSIAQSDSGSFTTATLLLVEINRTTLACSFLGSSATVDLDGVFQLRGCVSPDETEYHIYLGYCVTFFRGPTVVTDSQTIIRYRFPVAGGTETLDLVANGAYLVSDPIVSDDIVYLVVGHDTLLSHALLPKLSVQRSYSLIEPNEGLDGHRVLARAMYEGIGGDCDGHAGVPASHISGGGPGTHEFSDGVVVLDVTGSRDGLNDYYTAELEFDLEPALGPPVQMNDDWILPGGYPKMLGRWGDQIEIGPQFYPDDIVVTAVAGTGAYTGSFTVCAVYVVIAPDGREVESQPSAFQNVTITAGNNIHVKVGTYKQPAGSDGVTTFGRGFIRIYSTTDGGSTLLRQITVENQPTVEFIEIDLLEPGLGPALYTEGGVIENTACPPFKVGMFWDGRLFVGGLAERGLVYVSKFIRTGKLPEMYFDGRFGIGDSEVLGMCPIDKNHAAIFHSGGISVITKGGPTDTGANPYEPQHLVDVEQKCENPRSLVTTPMGCVFQGTDGGIYLLTRSLQVVFIGRGIDDYRTSTVTSAVYLTKAQHLRLTLDNRHVVVFDFGRKPVVQSDPEDSIGQWYDWDVPFGSDPVAATVKDGVHYVLAEDGKVWPQVASQSFDGSDTFIGMRLRLPLTLAGISAYLRCLRGVLVNKWVGAHQVQLTLDIDGTSYQPPAKTLATSTGRVDFRPNPSKAGYFELTIEELQHEDSLNKGFKFEGLGLLIQRQPGLGRTTSRFED